jgi:hypothetical protein
LAASLQPNYIQEAVTALENQWSASSSLNYWQRRSPDAQAEPYPDDLDDTALGVGILAQAGLLTPQQSAQVTRLLLQLETAPGGPYRTWCSSEAEWHNIDPVVNANTAWALQQCGVTLPALTAYLEDALSRDLPSPYYADRWVTRYLLLRTLSATAAKRRLAKTWLRSDPPTNLIAVAACVLVLQHVQLSIPASLKQQLEQATEYPLLPVIIENSGAQPVYAGSPALTQAFCEAAHLALQAKTASSVSLCYVEFASELALLTPELTTPLRITLERLAKADSQGILADAAGRCADQLSLTITPEQRHLLTQATIWGWLAYTLADAVIDGEADSSLLPVVQLATRRTTERFSAAAGPSFLPTVHALLDRVDAANAWELAHARLSHPSHADFPPLSERSIAHALGPLAILQLTQQPHTEAVLNLYEAYLALRQHLDDAHDWLADHDQGIRTPVGDVVRAATNGPTKTDLRIAFERFGVPYTLEEGHRYKLQLNAARTKLPPTWNNLLQDEEKRLTEALQQFADAVSYVQALRT